MAPFDCRCDSKTGFIHDADGGLIGERVTVPFVNINLDKDLICPAEIQIVRGSPSDRFRVLTENIQRLVFGKIQRDLLLGNSSGFDTGDVAEVTFQFRTVGGDSLRRGLM